MWKIGETIRSNFTWLDLYLLDLSNDLTCSIVTTVAGDLHMCDLLPFLKHLKHKFDISSVKKLSFLADWDKMSHTDWNWSWSLTRCLWLEFWIWSVSQEWCKISSNCLTHITTTNVIWDCEVTSCWMDEPVKGPLSSAIATSSPVKGQRVCGGGQCRFKGERAHCLCGEKWFRDFGYSAAAGSTQ